MLSGYHSGMVSTYKCRKTVRSASALKKPFTPIKNKIFVVFGGSWFPPYLPN